MNAKNLMVNDIVRVCNVHNEIVDEIVKVTSVSEDTICYYNQYGCLVETEDFGDHGEDILSGVPLTEDILLKNGFGKHANKNCWKLGNLNITGDMEVFIYKMHVKLNFVHELQKVLRIIGYGGLADNITIK